MNVLKILSSVINPIAGLVDKLHTSDEERGKIHNALSKMENELAFQILEYEGKALQAKADIINTEAKGESWFQRNWRPITMLTFLLLIVCHYAGVLAFEIAEQMWTLLQIGIGGYIGSRGVEKVTDKIAQHVPTIIDALKSRKE